MYTTFWLSKFYIQHTSLFTVLLEQNIIPPKCKRNHVSSLAIVWRWAAMDSLNGMVHRMRDGGGVSFAFDLMQLPQQDEVVPPATLERVLRLLTKRMGSRTRNECDWDCVVQTLYYNLVDEYVYKNLAPKSIYGWFNSKSIALYAVLIWSFVAVKKQVLQLTRFPNRRCHTPSSRQNKLRNLQILTVAQSWPAPSR
jgi:hypothetical protein